MKSPIVWQSLEDELRPITKYIRGATLNAGSGSRDISAFLREKGAATVDNCDLKSSIPGAIIANLAEIPVESDRYDTIVFNAVLEHVHYADKVIQELRRVLKPGGHLLLCVPFTQPYHGEADYRRYSRDGLLELAALHKFETVEMFPVHTLAQTVAWIWWSHMGEKRQKLGLALMWLPFYLWTSLSCKTDFSLVRQANSYQIVLKKP